MTDTTLIQRIKDLTARFGNGWHDGIQIDASDIADLCLAADALEQQAAQIAMLEQRATCGCGDQFTAHDPGTCGNCCAAADRSNEIDALRADAERMRALLESSLRYLNDPALMKDELTGRRRDETRQEYADRLSDWIQENEDLRLLQEDIDAALRQEQPT